MASLETAVQRATIEAPPETRAKRDELEALRMNTLVDRLRAIDEESLCLAGLLMYVSTAEEAALCYARTLEARDVAAAAAAPPPPPPMTAEEALRQAEEEGLTLLRSESSSTGYNGVSFDSSRPKPYHAKVRRGGKQVALGTFSTAEEAALCYARTPEGRRAVAASAASPSPPPMTAEEALRQAEAEGLVLRRSDSNIIVTFNIGRPKPYQAKVQRGRRTVALGYFATAEEAALAVARDSGAQAAAPQPLVFTSLGKRKVKSEEQPPDMPAGTRVKLEEEPPPMPSDAHVKLEFESRFESSAENRVVQPLCDIFNTLTHFDADRRD